MFYDKTMGMNTSTTRSITYNGDTIECELTIKRVEEQEHVYYKEWCDPGVGECVCANKNKSS